MTVVVDSSALVAYCLNEKQHHIERISEILRNGAISADIIVTESANAILIANRRGLVDTENAKKALESALELIEINLRIVPQVELIKGAFDLARESKLTVYDALFIFLAKKTDSNLLSVDGDQTKIASKMGVNLVEL